MIWKFISLFMYGFLWRADENYGNSLWKLHSKTHICMLRQTDQFSRPFTGNPEISIYLQVACYLTTFKWVLVTFVSLILTLLLNWYSKFEIKPLSKTTKFVCYIAPTLKVSFTFWKKLPKRNAKMTLILCSVFPLLFEF